LRDAFQILGGADPAGWAHRRARLQRDAALLAALIAFAPSFAFVIAGALHFDQIRADRSVESFLTGAGPAVIGAIAGSAIPLGLSFQHLWQIPVLAGALVWLFGLRRGVVSSLLIAGAIGALMVLSGIPV
jgi:chromate transporter